MPVSASLIVAYPPLAERLPAVQEAAGRVSVLDTPNEEAAVGHMPKADAFIGRLTPRMLEASERLRWVQCPTASLEHYVFPQLVEHPATLTNAAGLFGDVVAEHVLGWVLSFTRNLHQYRDNQSRGIWCKAGGGDELPEFVAGPAVISSVDRAHRRIAKTRTLIVGFGSIGRAIGDRISALGGQVEAVDPEAIHTKIEVRGLSSLDERLPLADFIILAAPETPLTRGLFGRLRFTRMQRDAVLINVGRGSLVDTEALANAIDRGQLGGAALDVVDPEPLPIDHRLWRMPNVLITPHVAAASPVIAERHLELICENVRRFVDGRPLRNVVDLSPWRVEGGSLPGENSSA